MPFRKANSQARGRIPAQESCREETEVCLKRNYGFRHQIWRRVSPTFGVHYNVRRLRGLVARHKGKLRAMKNTHTCPKCNSQEIMRIEGRMGGYSGGNDIPAGSFSFRTVKVTRYLCGSCGFSEEWIDAPEDLHKLKEKYGSS